MSLESNLQKLALRNRLKYRSIIPTEPANLPAVFKNLDTTTGLGKLEDAQGNVVYGKAITNGAVGKGEIVAKKEGAIPRYDATPYIKPTQVKDINPQVAIYPVISLLFADLSLDDGSGAYWLVGDKFKLKQRDNLDLSPTERSAYVGWVQNNGKNKYKLARAIYKNLVSYGGVSNRRFFPMYIGGEQPDINSLAYLFGEPINSRRNYPFLYMGNGYWQSMVEDGTGQMLDNLPNPTPGEIPGAVMYNVGDGAGGSRFEGISYIDSSQPNNQGTRLDACFLPEDGNYLVKDGEIEFFQGAIDIDLDDYTASITSSGGLIANIAPRFGYRNKTITHNTWTPEGIKIVNYSAVRSGTELEPIYTENLSGETLAIANQSNYLLHDFQLQKQTINELDDLIERVNISKNDLYLKDYNSQDFIKINTTGKFLVLPTPNINTEQTTYQISATDSRALQVSTLMYKVVNYRDNNPDFDLSTYIGESTIATQLLNDGNVYLIRGEITAIAYDEGLNIGSNRTVTAAINITSKQRIPKVVAKNSNNFFTSTAIPFFSTILDNGCFWNYYLSVLVDRGSAIPAYPKFTRQVFPTPQTGLAPWYFFYARPNKNFALLCDQSLPFIPLNPITHALFTYNYYWNFYPVQELLRSDTFVKNKIYRVCDYYYLSSDFDTDELTDLPQIQKIPITEWTIQSNGNVKYTDTFLADYNFRLPYYAQGQRSRRYDGYFLSHSYHP